MRHSGIDEEGATPPSTVQKEMDAIRKKLKHLTEDKQPTLWLNTGSKDLNAVLGSKELGVPYGRMIEVFGPNSHGKTVVSLLLAAMAQADKAKVAVLDFERSCDKMWATANGVDYENLYVFRPLIGRFGSEKIKRLQTAEEVCTEAELWMEVQHDKDPTGKMVMIVDSMAAMLVEDEAEGGITNQNMATNMALPKFISKLMRRWVALADNYNVMIIWINQIRTKIGSWGNPEDSPGGLAAKHYCSVRVAVRRLQGGRIVQGKDVVGLRSVIKNIKNKAGGGSIEGKEIGFETRFGKKHWKFAPPSTLVPKKESD